MWRDTFIAVHTVTATIALAAGVVSLWRTAVFFAVYLWSLLAMEVFLVLAIAVEWDELDAVNQPVFAALAALGAAMAILAWQSRGRAATSPGYIERVGFTLVALVDAFAVITVLKTGAPGWAVAVTAVAIAGLGHVALRAVRKARAGPDTARDG
ncbi:MULTISPECIES: hypothetical protein [Streptomyces]|uniref:hypothetical protein n=1 Tax=Streptomyces TaxID=1883 RepID=UPI0004C60BE7|nr:hypothetical protein [Streptomyces sp. NRRL F-5053]